MILFEEERSWWERIIHTDLLCWAVQWGWFARVNALCNLSRKKSREVAASLPGRSPSRRCFTLCITMEVEPRIARQYKCHHCCSCKNYRVKGMEGTKTVSLRRCFGWPEEGEFAWKKCVLGYPQYSTSNKLLLVARHILPTEYRPPKMSLKLAV